MAPRSSTAAAPVVPNASERKLMRYKKAPDAPKRFKSAFIIFSAEKHKIIKEDLVKQGRTEKVRTTDIAKLVSEAWRELEPDDKEVWEKKARTDKARYEVEKAMYTGPWKVPANKRTPKDPTAPKRPMSAFLAFSNKRRAALKRLNPDATNADLSKMLSVTWREAPDELRKKYMEEEAELRARYKVRMAEWRKKVAEEKKEERKEREALALQAAEVRAAQIKAGEPVAPLGGLRLGGDQAGTPGAGMQMQGGMQGNPGMFNPYLAGMQGGMQGGMHGMGDMNATGFQGGYPGMMANPFAAQQMMQQMPAGSAQQQQQLLNQFVASQQFMQQQQQLGMGMYGQTMPQQMGQQGSMNGFQQMQGDFGAPPQQQQQGQGGEQPEEKNDGNFEGSM